MSESNQFCTFYLNDLFFGFKVNEVQEVFRFQDMTRVPLAPPAVSGLINLRGQIVPAIDLRERLGMENRPSGQDPMNIVVRIDDGIVSFLVDRIGDVLEVDQNSYETAPETVDDIARDMIRGVYKLKDRLLLVLDTKKAIDIFQSSAATEDRN